MYPCSLRQVQLFIHGPRHAKTCLWAFADNKSPDQQAQSDQGLHCPLTESLDTTECLNGEQRPGQYFAHAQADLNLHILCMFEGTFLLVADHIKHKEYEIC